MATGRRGGDDGAGPVDALVEAVVARLHALWRETRASLEAQLARLTREMEAAHAAGQKVDPMWLLQWRHLRALLATITARVDAYAQHARTATGHAQADAARDGADTAYTHLRAQLTTILTSGASGAGGGVRLSAVSRDALAQMADALSPDSPTYHLFDTYGADAAQAARDALFTGVTLGDNPRSIARAMLEACDMSARRAEVIARTEVLRAYRRAAFAGYRANNHVVGQWRWQCAFGPRTCGVCLAMDGTLHSLDEELNDHVCGRCTAVPVTRSYADILSAVGIDASDVPGLSETSASADTVTGETGAQWFARQSRGVQNVILGPAKATAYRAGDLTLSDLVDIQHDPLWGASVREKSLSELGLSAATYLKRARQQRKG